MSSSAKQTAHGKTYEPVALKEYEKYMFSTRNPVSVFNCFISQRTNVKMSMLRRRYLYQPPLRGSSRVPAPRTCVTNVCDFRGAGTRDEALRTSAREAISGAPNEDVVQNHLT